MGSKIVLSINNGINSGKVVNRDDNAVSTKTVPIRHNQSESAPKTSHSVLGTILRNMFIASSELNKPHNWKEAQQVFQDVFMNKGIELGEAAVMVQRYKEIEKIEDKEEYIKALFKEAKSNYGFGNSNIKLEIRPPEMLKGAIGGSDPAMCSVQIRSDIPRSRIFDTIHHEFRHHKQHYFAFNLSPQDYMQAVNKKIEIMTNGMTKNIWKDVNKFISWIESNLNEKQSADNVPADYINFARNCIKATSGYKDVNEDKIAYWNNFLEIDARTAAKKLEKVVR